MAPRARRVNRTQANALQEPEEGEYFPLEDVSGSETEEPAPARARQSAWDTTDSHRDIQVNNPSVPIVWKAGAADIRYFFETDPETGKKICKFCK